MAGTDKQKQPVQNSPAPAIILVQPQLGENIGMCARAMLNCGVTELRIVAPRDGWPNPDAISAASGAIDVLNGARLYDTTADAVADLEYVFATTTRNREIVKDIYTAEAAGRKVREINTSPSPALRERAGERVLECEASSSPHAPSPSHRCAAGPSLSRKAGEGANKCGILFGPERTGLENDDVARASAILTIPLNPGFSSLNLAQAVLLACYSWLSADNPFAQGEVSSVYGNTEPAKREDIESLMAHMEDELAAHGFFRSPEKRPSLMRNLRNFFFRSGITQQEAQTLHGVLSCLSGKKSWK